ncbi:hypothetical protein [Cryobacterium sp. Hh7]|uniref:hypothetical protein n=1 Tax=Cryobacterium sp. Hh7 TaxID=1259159 RepID=UPI00141B31B3|nr:hypothetical protein [Cryobacterium sp. Hh7]
MSAPRYVPRDLCAEPGSFGKAREVRWLPATDERSAALGRAARLQHMYAVRIRVRAKEITKGIVAPDPTGPLAARPGADAHAPLKTLANKSGSSYARLLRCLRGEIVMRLDDIAWADLVLGEISDARRSAPVGQRPGSSQQ